MPAKISFFWLVNSITRATRVSSNALTDERSMISMPGSASTSSGNVGPHILSRAAVITMIGNFSPFAALARATTLCFKRVLVVSPTFLDHYGGPENPADLPKFATVASIDDIFDRGALELNES